MSLQQQLQAIERGLQAAQVGQAISAANANQAVWVRPAIGGKDIRAIAGDNIIGGQVNIFRDERGTYWAFSGAPSGASLVEPGRLLRTREEPVVGQDPQVLPVMIFSHLTVEYTGSKVDAVSDIPVHRTFDNLYIQFGDQQAFRCFGGSPRTNIPNNGTASLVDPPVDYTVVEPGFIPKSLGLIRSHEKIHLNVIEGPLALLQFLTHTRTYTPNTAQVGDNSFVSLTAHLKTLVISPAGVVESWSQRLSGEPTKLSGFNGSVIESGTEVESFAYPTSLLPYLPYLMPESLADLAYGEGRSTGQAASYTFHTFSVENEEDNILNSSLPAYSQAIDAIRAFDDSGEAPERTLGNFPASDGQTGRTDSARLYVNASQGGVTALLRDEAQLNKFDFPNLFGGVDLTFETSNGVVGRQVRVNLPDDLLTTSFTVRSLNDLEGFFLGPFNAYSGPPLLSVTASSPGGTTLQELVDEGSPFTLFSYILEPQMPPFFEDQPNYGTFTLSAMKALLL